MPTVKCPKCGKKIDTSFYGACLDCGTLLSDTSHGHAGSDAEVPQPIPASQPSESQSSDSQPRFFETDSNPDEPAPPATQQTSRSGRFGTGLLVRLGLAGLIFGGSAIAGIINSADRGDGGEIIDAGTLTANELQVGDCLDTPGTEGTDETFDSVEAIPCTELHDLEVYSLASYPSVQGVPYPGDDVITDWGFNACLERFTGYVGAPYEVVPDIDITIFWPSEQGWDEGDRIVHCLLVHIEDGVKLTGSLRGREA